MGHIAGCKCKLLGSCPAFDLTFTAGRGHAVSVFFKVNDVARAKYPCCAASPALIVLATAARKRVGMADIETTITHLHDVNIERHDVICVNRWKCR
jgi:hypothetical protein